jgi:hypothetical protein
MSNFGRIKVVPKSGNESLTIAGQEIGCTLIDFWRWSGSDLISNASRGRLAEFIVARALGIRTDGVRDEWGACDLTAAGMKSGGVKIEVKSAAFVQTWYQEHLSSIRFVVPKTRAYDPETNLLSAEAKRQADVYVFAVLAEKDKERIDPLDLDQWEFYVLPTAMLDARTRSQHSITLKTLCGLAGGPVGYRQLKERVSASIQTREQGTVQPSTPADVGRPCPAASDALGPAPLS